MVTTGTVIPLPPCGRTDPLDPARFITASPSSLPTAEHSTITFEAPLRPKFAWNTAAFSGNASHLITRPIDPTQRDHNSVSRPCYPLHSITVIPSRTMLRRTYRI